MCNSAELDALIQNKKLSMSMAGGSASSGGLPHSVTLQQLKNVPSSVTGQCAGSFAELCTCGHLTSISYGTCVCA